MTFTFVGSIDLNSIKPLLEKYIASLPSTYGHEQAKDLGIHTPNGRFDKTIFKGSEAKAVVQLFFTGEFPYNSKEILKMSALKETLQIRLLERLREDESGVYSPTVFVNMAKFPSERYRFGIAFGCAPQNVDKLIASTLDEIEKTKSKGPSQVNINKFLAENERRRETEIKTNAWWLNYISGQVQNNDDLNQIQSYASEQKSLTPESIKESAENYLSGKNFIRMVLLPEHGQ